MISNDWVVSARAIHEEIIEERRRQDSKWGTGNILWRSVEAGIPVLVEEVGEVCKAVLEKNRSQCRTELIHVAAVAVCMIEALARSATLTERKDTGGHACIP